jgi:hypothetical protein
MNEPTSTNDFNIQNLAQQLKTIANQAIPLYRQKVKDIKNKETQ